MKLSILFILLSLTISSLKSQNWIEQNVPKANVSTSFILTKNNEIYTYYSGNYYVKSSSGNEWSILDWKVKDSVYNISIAKTIEGNIFIGGVSDPLSKDAITKLFYSKDNGNSWSNILGSFKIGTIRDFEISKSNWYLQTDSYLYKSTNSGLNWDTLSFGEGSNLEVRNDTLIATKNLNGGIGSNAGLGVKISTDGGETWLAKEKGLLTNNIYSLKQYDDDIILVGTSAGLFKSTNYGEKWEGISKNAYNLEVINLYRDNDTILFTTKQSRIYRSNDFGSTWELISENKPLGIRNFEKINGELYISSSYGVSKFKNKEIEHIFKQNCSLSDMKVFDDKMYVLATTNGIFERKNDEYEWNVLIDTLYDYKVYLNSFNINQNNILAYVNNNLLVSNDFGKNWSTQNIDNHGTFITDIINMNGNLIASTSQSPYISKDNGISWNKYHIYFQPDSLYVRIYKFYKHRELLYAGTEYAGVILSKDNGESWEKLDKDTNSIVYNMKVTSLLVNENTILAGNDKSEWFLSKDYGISWKEAKLPLKIVGNNRVCNYKNNFFIISQEGLFFTKDGGISWEHDKTFNFESFTYSPIKSLLIYKDNIVLTTNNNIYSSKLSDFGIQFTNVESQVLTPKIYPNPVNETVTISGIEQGKVEIFNSLGQMLIQSDIQGNSTINTSNLQTGIYIIKIESNGEVRIEKMVVSK